MTPADYAHRKEVRNLKRALGRQKRLNREILWLADERLKLLLEILKNEH